MINLCKEGIPLENLKYYITDTKSAAKDKTYYEGYTPNDWGTQAMAVWFHNEMFGYTAWEVVNWS